MRILITAATAAELLPAQEVWEVIRNQADNQHRIECLETGIGCTATAYHTVKALSVQADTPCDLIINIGIAGSFCDSLPLGSVVRVASDSLGDCGIQTASGFQSLFDSQLLDAETFPFSSGKLTPAPLPHGEPALAFLHAVEGVTVQHLIETGLAALHAHAQVETMEGAAFFYVCMSEGVPCVALRAVSNMAGERDKSKWNIPLALHELRKALASFLNAL